MWHLHTSSSQAHCIRGLQCARMSHVTHTKKAHHTHTNESCHGSERVFFSAQAHCIWVKAPLRMVMVRMWVTSLCRRRALRAFTPGLRRHHRSCEVHRYVYSYVYVCKLIHVYTCIHICIYAQVWKYLCMYVCVYIYMSMKQLRGTTVFVYVYTKNIRIVTRICT